MAGEHYAALFRADERRCELLFLRLTMGKERVEQARSMLGELRELERELLGDDSPQYCERLHSLGAAPGRGCTTAATRCPHRSSAAPTTMR